MLISSAPIAIPINTANLAAESVAVDVAKRPQIPQPTSAAENPSAKNSTEFNEQAKTEFSNQLQSETEKNIKEKESSEQQKEQNPDQETNEKSANGANQELDFDQLRQVEKLKSVDSEVRAHEQAHAAVGGSFAGAPSLSFTTGPDGKRYAISGEVSIDTSAVSGDPAATIRKLEQVQRAALAPANPSSQDVKVASQASSSVNLARAELNAERFEENQSVESKKEDKDSTEIKGSDDAKSLDQKERVNTAKQQTADLHRKILGSGALNRTTQGHFLSLTA